MRIETYEESFTIFCIYSMNINKQKYYMSNTQQHTHTPQKTSHESIKRGLQKIKQAQIQVMRELGKDDPHYSINHSLTYSKQTLIDTRPPFRTDGDAFQLKNRPIKLETGLPEFSATEGKSRQQSIYMGDQIRKYKEAAQKAQAKMKEYEQSQQKALNKAQNAYSNAIASQKKYISLKGQFDKINKERDRLSNDLKKLQRKDLSNLANAPQNEGNIPSKIIKQLIEVHDCLKQLIGKVNSHKCPKSSLDSKSSNTSLNSSANSFTISTFEIQNSLDKNMTKLIGHFKSLQSLGIIQHNLQNSSSGVYGLQNSNHYLSNSFQQDIRLIEQEIQKGKNTHSGHEGDQEVLVLQNKVKVLAKQNEEISNEFESFKIKAKQRELQKDLQIEIWKKKQRMAQDSSRRSRNDSDYDRNSSRNSLENLQERLQQIERQNRKLREKLSSLHKSQQNHMQTIQQLKLDLQLTNATKQQLDTQNSQNARNNGTASSNRTQYEWDQMLELVTNLSQEKQRLAQSQKKMDGLMQQQNLKYQQVIQQMEQQLKSLRKQIQELQSTHQRQNFNRIRTEEAERKKVYGHQPATQQSPNLIQAQFTQNNYHRQNIQPQYIEQIQNRHYAQYNAPMYQQQQVIQQVQQLPDQEQILYSPIPHKIVMGNEIMPTAYGHVQSYGSYPVHYQVQHPNISQGTIMGYSGGHPVYR